jgi:ABC-type branched-subunit amino acid transport system ATPase component
VEKRATVYLRATGVAKAFAGNQVLRGVNVDIEPGSVALLRGPNGCGKTTLINILTGNLPPDRGRIEMTYGTGGAAFDFPMSWKRRLTPPFFGPESMAGLGMGRSWQDVRLFGRQTVLNNIAIAAPAQPGENPFLRILRPGWSRTREREVLDGARAILGDLHLEGQASRLAGQLPLCEAKRLAILRTVHAGASLLFLDEPLSGLDEAEIDSVLDLLAALVKAHQVSLVIVEHTFNILPILELATVTWTMDEGRLTVEDPDEVRERLLHETGGLLENWMQSIPGGERIELDDTAAMTVFRRPGGGRAAALEIDDLKVSRGSRVVVGRRRPFALNLAPGDLAVLSAPNGWGKTTLCDSVAGLLPYSAGTVKLDGVELAKTTARAGAGLAYLRSQNNLFDSLTVAENAKLFDADVVGWRPSRRVESLSGGERQRLAWEIITRKKPRVLLLDEPFLSLDAQTVQRFLEQLSTNTSCAVLLCIPKQLQSLHPRRIPSKKGEWG